MGFVEFLLIVVMLVIAAAVANWIIGQVPNAPAIIPKIIWILVVCGILYLLLSATGLLGKDIRIPHV